MSPFSLLLAKAAQLDDNEATTHWGSIETLKKAAPKTNVHADRRIVDNGKVVTTAGVSAGIDGALHVVERLLGKQAAKDTARDMEYRWEGEFAEEVRDQRKTRFTKAECLNVPRSLRPLYRRPQAIPFSNWPVLGNRS